MVGGHLLEQRVEGRVIQLASSVVYESTEGVGHHLEGRDCRAHPFRGVQDDARVLQVETRTETRV
jgi:hypothetical protein